MIPAFAQCIPVWPQQHCRCRCTCSLKLLPGGCLFSLCSLQNNRELGPLLIAADRSLGDAARKNICIRSATNSKPGPSLCFFPKTLSFFLYFMCKLRLRKLKYITGTHFQYLKKNCVATLDKLFSIGIMSLYHYILLSSKNHISGSEFLQAPLILLTSVYSVTDWHCDALEA